MRVLRYAVRLPMLLRYFGQLCTALAALTLVPFSVSLLFGDFRVSAHYLVVIVGVSLLGVCLMRLQAPKRMQSNEAMVVVGSIFVFSPLVLTWPVMASGLGFLDAFTQRDSLCRYASRPPGNRRLAGIFIPGNMDRTQEGGIK